MFHGGKSHPHSEMKVMFSKGGRHATIWDGEKGLSFLLKQN